MHTEVIASAVAKQRPGYRIAKRGFDLFFALVLAVPVLLLSLAIAVMIKIDTPGPVLFCHKRIGKDGKPLGLWKFRSMVVDAEQLIDQFSPEQIAEWQADCKLKHDPRITRLGKILRKTSLDELPQLINIFQGNLSFVGPRPVVALELEKYGDQKAKFLSVMPGLTGLWQARGRSLMNYDQRIKMELEYVDTASFLFDIRIILETVVAVFTGRGAV